MGNNIRSSSRPKALWRGLMIRSTNRLMNGSYLQGAIIFIAIGWFWVQAAHPVGAKL